MKVVYKKSFHQQFREMLQKHDETLSTHKIDYVELDRNEVSEMVTTMSHLSFRFNSWDVADITRSGKADLYGIPVRWAPFE